MGLPKSVKEQILVDSARHCCVCHRYKGVKVEAHHIIPEASGGPNTYDNSIALCFDCHTDAGHYNSNHPRGLKFSPTELEKAKYKWLEIVKDNRIEQPEDPDIFYCRYYVCKNFEALVEIANNDLSNFPVEKPLLVDNEIVSSLRKIIDEHPFAHRSASVLGKQFASKDEYLELYPDSKAYLSSESLRKYPYFNSVRTPTFSELQEIESQDGLLKLMLEENLPIKKIVSIVGCYEAACEGIELQEEYVLRSLWCSFLAITNITDRPLALESISGQNNRAKGFSPLNISNQETETIPLPKAAIESNSTVLFPTALIIPPLSPLKTEVWSSSSSGGLSVGWKKPRQDVTHERIHPENIADCLVYGSQIATRAIKYKLAGNIYSQKIHQFDLTNMYAIDRCWGYGSCPHLFFVKSDISYAKELLAHCEQKKGKERFAVPDNVNAIVIAEIEDELTEITSIKSNGMLFFENIILRKSDFLEIPVSGGEHIEISGQYIPENIAITSSPKGIKRNDLVSKFLHDYSREFSKTRTRGHQKGPVIRRFAF